MPCVLCNDHQVQGRAVFGANGQLRMAQLFDCRRCGRFEATTALLDDVRDRPEWFRPLLGALSAYTRQTSEAGTVPLLTTDNFARAASGHVTTSVKTKLRRILEHLGRQSQYPGDPVSLDPDTFPLFDVHERGHMGFLLNTLEARGYVSRGGINHLGHQAWTVTADGWEQLTPGIVGGTPGTVFVAMAFRDDLQDAYDTAIQPAIEVDCALTVTQVSRIEHNDSVTDLIISGIRAAQIVVADVTHQRNGVYFEGGFAMGLGRIVVWMCREDDIANVHFDTSHFNHIVWADHADLRTKLRNRLRATVATGNANLQPRP